MRNAFLASPYRTFLAHFYCFDQFILACMAAVLISRPGLAKIAWDYALGVGVAMGIIAGSLLVLHPPHFWRCWWWYSSVLIVMLAIQLSRLTHAKLLSSAASQLNELFSLIDRQIAVRLRRIKEYELIARGYRIQSDPKSQLPPVSRMEASSFTAGNSLQQIRFRRIRSQLKHSIDHLFSGYRALVDIIVFENEGPCDNATENTAAPHRNGYESTETSDNSETLTLERLNADWQELRAAHRQSINELEALHCDGDEYFSNQFDSFAAGRIFSALISVLSQLKGLLTSQIMKNQPGDYWKELLSSASFSSSSSSLENQQATATPPAAISSIVCGMHLVEYKLSLLAGSTEITTRKSMLEQDFIGSELRQLVSEWDAWRKSSLRQINRPAAAVIVEHHEKGMTEKLQFADKAASISDKHEEGDDCSDTESMGLCMQSKVAVYEFDGLSNQNDINERQALNRQKLSRAERIALMKQRRQEEELAARNNRSQLEVSQQMLGELQSVLQLKNYQGIKM